MAMNSGWCREYPEEGASSRLPVIKWPVPSRQFPVLKTGNWPLGTPPSETMPTVKLSADEVITQLKRLARPGNLVGMARYGMNPEGRLGLPVPVMRRIAKQAGRDHRLALDLWKSGIAEARMVASMVDDPARVTPAQMDRWVRGFNSWDVCDQVCGNLFDKTPHAWAKAREWAKRDEEYVKRAGFALMAYLAWHDKAAPDSAFIRTS